MYNFCGGGWLEDALRMIIIGVIIGIDPWRAFVEAMHLAIVAVELYSIRDVRLSYALVAGYLCFSALFIRRPAGFKMQGLELLRTNRVRCPTYVYI